jgi:hypothetical protein
MSQNQNNQNQDPMKDPAMWLIVGFVGIAVWSQKQYQIKIWFYENMMSFVFLGLVLIAALGLYVRWRIRRKHKNYFERRENLKSMQPTYRPNDYYKRRGLDD